MLSEQMLRQPRCSDDRRQRACLHIFRRLVRSDNHETDLPFDDSAVDAMAAFAMSCQGKSVLFENGNDAGKIHAAQETGNAADVSSPIRE